LFIRISSFIRHPISVQKRPCYTRAYYEIHVLWNITSQLSKLNRIQLSDNDPDNISRKIEERPSTIARLHRGRHLHQSTVVTPP